MHPVYNDECPVPTGVHFLCIVRLRWLCRAPGRAGRWTGQGAVLSCRAGRFGLTLTLVYGPARSLASWWTARLGRPDRRRVVRGSSAAAVSVDRRLSRGVGRNEPGISVRADGVGRPRLPPCPCHRPRPRHRPRHRHQHCCHRPFARLAYISPMTFPFLDPAHAAAATDPIVVWR